MAQKMSLNYFPKSLISTLKKTDYSPWQRDNTAKKTAPFKVLLPPVKSVTVKKEDARPSPSKPKDKASGKKSTSPSCSKNICLRREKTGQQKASGSEIMLTKSMANIKILQRLSKAKRNSLEEMKRHSRFLLEKNRQLLEDIQQKDADTARCARELLQQYDMFGEKVLEYQGGLQQMARNNQELRRQIQMQKKIIDDLEKEIVLLQKSTAMLHECVRHPRVVIFDDVLLQRPICTPDMEIILNIPKAEDLPL